MVKPYWGCTIGLMGLMQQFLFSFRSLYTASKSPAVFAFGSTNEWMTEGLATRAGVVVLADMTNTDGVLKALGLTSKD